MSIFVSVWPRLAMDCFHTSKPNVLSSIKLCTIVVHLWHWDFCYTEMKTGMNSTTLTRSSYVSQSEQNIELHFHTCTIIYHIRFICHGMYCLFWFIVVIVLYALKIKYNKTVLLFWHFLQRSIWNHNYSKLQGTFITLTLFNICVFYICD